MGLGLMFTNFASALPECKGNDKNISKYSKRYFKKARKWTNCHGTLIIYKVGTKYVGEFKDGNYHGQGTYTGAGGTKYVGGWKDGNYHGQGTHTWINGSKYVGEFKDGIQHGQGTWTHPSGEKYVGEWRDREYSGQGT